jgi:hypothetical protein
MPWPTADLRPALHVASSTLAESAHGTAEALVAKTIERLRELKKAAYARSSR